MRRLEMEGKLSGPASDLMKPMPYELFYDTETDPSEIHDLTGSLQEDHREALVRLRATLDTWIVETGDRGAAPEPDSVVAPFTAEVEQWFGTPAWYRERPGN